MVFKAERFPTSESPGLAAQQEYPMPCVKGQSGNPAGRPVGSRNRFTREMREALEERGPDLIDRLAELAREANPAAMRLCYERLVPTGKHRAVAVELPSP